MTSTLNPRPAERRDVVVRDATDADMDRVQQIYAHHVLHTLSTFEEVPPTTDELLTRKTAVLAAGLPYLVAELDGRVVGYCYAVVYRPRRAYRFTVEDSIFIADDAQRRGIGSLLLGTLIDRCAAGPWRQMVAVLGNGTNAASITLHERFGFRRAGTLTAAGYKFGQWLDTLIMQRELGPGGRTPPDPDRAGT